MKKVRCIKTRKVKKCLVFLGTRSSSCDSCKTGFQTALSSQFSCYYYYMLSFASLPHHNCSCLFLSGRLLHSIYYYYRDASSKKVTDRLLLEHEMNSVPECERPLLFQNRVFQARFFNSVTIDLNRLNLTYFFKQLFLDHKKN